MVRQLHDGMTERVTDNDVVSEAFSVTNGVKQGCILAPTILSFIFITMLLDDYRDERHGIRIAYMSESHLLTHRWMHFQSHASANSVHELLFVAD
nr:unnamed protein product [Spirometra erinaceieuropaei]